MGDADVGLALGQAVGDVQRATGVAHRHHFRAGGADVADLALEQLVGHFRLGDVVNTGAATAPRALRQLGQFQSGDCLEQLPWLRGDFLAVAQVAGFVVGDFLRLAKCLAAWLAHAPISVSHS